MSLISYTPLQDGVTGVNASATNTPLSTIYNDYNGNITDANIASAAAIAGSKINMVSIRNPYKFRGYITTGNSFTNGNATVAAFDTENFDTGGNFDTTTNKGRFTAPIAGFYWFAGRLRSSSGSITQAQAYLYKNGSIYSQGNQLFNSASFPAPVCSDIISLVAGDYVELAGRFVGATAAISTGSDECWFSGFLISAT